jgi:hypothetical protein
VTDARAQLLRTAVGFALVPPTEPELRLLHRWLDSWRGMSVRAQDRIDVLGFAAPTAKVDATLDGDGTPHAIEIRLDLVSTQSRLVRDAVDTERSIDDQYGDRAAYSGTILPPAGRARTTLRGNEGIPRLGVLDRYGLTSKPRRRRSASQSPAQPRWKRKVRPSAASNSYSI